MLSGLDNAFVLERMFGRDTDVFDNAILSVLHFQFGSNSPVSPHRQNIRLALEFQTFCKVLHPPKRWERSVWDSVYIYITVFVDNIEVNLRNAAMEESPLKVLSHKTEILSPQNGFASYCSEFIFEQDYRIRFSHSIGHIQNVSNHKKYIE